MAPPPLACERKFLAVARSGDERNVPCGVVGAGAGEAFAMFGGGNAEAPGEDAAKAIGAAKAHAERDLVAGPAGHALENPLEVAKAHLCAQLPVDIDRRVGRRQFAAMIPAGRGAETLGGGQPCS